MEVQPAEVKDRSRAPNWNYLLKQSHKARLGCYEAGASNASSIA
jgi:hypothetical protein